MHVERRCILQTSVSFYFTNQMRRLFVRTRLLCLPTKETCVCKYMFPFMTTLLEMATRVSFLVHHWRHVLIKTCLLWWRPNWRCLFRANVSFIFEHKRHSVLSEALSCQPLALRQLHFIATHATWLCAIAGLPRRRSLPPANSTMHALSSWVRLSSESQRCSVDIS